MLLAANFGEQSKVTSGLALPEGKMAVTVETGAPEQVAGYVQAGLAGRRSSSPTPWWTPNGHEHQHRADPGAAAAGRGARRRHVPERAHHDRRTTGPPASPVGSVMLTVAVTQAEAERLIEGLSHGTLYLGLLTDSVQMSAGRRAWTIPTAARGGIARCSSDAVRRC